jgi:hypothetical protein
MIIGNVISSLYPRLNREANEIIVSEFAFDEEMFKFS